MTQSCRLPAGGRIDRRTPLHFTFNGRRYEGHAGDTLASALLANGVHVVARSWKYHRPRGIVGGGVEEPNAIVQLETGARHRAQRARDRGDALRRPRRAQRQRVAERRLRPDGVDAVSSRG